MTERNELQSFKDSIYDLIDAYNLTYGDICGTFQDIMFEIRYDLEQDNEKNEDSLDNE
jgi:hypothetical protein